MKKLILSLLFSLIFFPIVSNAEVKPIIDGNSDAKIKLVVFESLTCSHCANFHKNIYPELKKDFIDNGLISIEYKNFPLDIAAFNASKIAHCKNDGNSDVLHYLYENQRQWVKGSSIEDANKNIKDLIEKSEFGINVDECLADKSVEDHILEDRINGVKKFKVEATPTLIINGEKFENPSNYKKLKKYLEKLI
jgi:protein-disulfide isomerase|tara:strand:+ start:783 stop:1361 length:579 start_codon:yes stop_codon:yes gene_type:complete